MPVEYVVEMICDWWSFSIMKSKPSEILDYYNENKSTIPLSDNSRNYTEKIMQIIENKKSQLEKDGSLK